MNLGDISNITMNRPANGNSLDASMIPDVQNLLRNLGTGGMSGRAGRGFTYSHQTGNRNNIPFEQNTASPPDMQH
jgi:hypothetical protein